MKKEALVALRTQAKQLRVEALRWLAKSGGGHVGSCLSAAELVAALYFHARKHDAAAPCWSQRDRFVLSKAHVLPLLGAAAMLAGYADEKTLRVCCEDAFGPQSQPVAVGAFEAGGTEASGASVAAGDLGASDMSLCALGVDAALPVPGLGFSVAVGMAQASQLLGLGHHTFCLLGDGECNVGRLWEAVLHAGAQRVAGLTVIVDFNRYQAGGDVDDILPLDPLAMKWEAFGWALREVEGHDLRQLCEALEWGRSVRRQPSVIVAHTLRGKGVSWLEAQPEVHHRAFSQNDLQRALQEIS